MDTSDLFIVGMDVGATKCRAKLCKFDLEPIQETTSLGANLFFDRDEAIKRIVSAIEKLLKNKAVRGIDPQKILINMGVAGSTLAENRERLRSAVDHLGQISILPDYSVVSYGCLAGKDGGVVSMGTGAVTTVSGTDRLRPDVVSGGFGYPVSDLGAGAWIGLEAIRYSILDEQKNDAQTPLTEQVLARFDGKLRSITRWSVNASAADYAAFAPLVSAAVKAGDTSAKYILRSALDYVRIYIEQLNDRNCETIVLSGGVGNMLLDVFPLELQDSVSPPELDGAEGACMMVRDCYGDFNFSNTHI